MDFSGKVVLITGASSGIGASCALLFANLSAKLALIGRNVFNLQNIAEKCEKAKGIKPLTITADITIDEDIKRIVAETIKHFGKLDVLVNNAGLLLFATVMDDVESFDRMVAANVRAPYLIIQQAMPHLIKSKGNIVNVSSILSEAPLPPLTAYCLSKSSLDMLTKCVALEYARKEVRVNSVNPGIVKTGLFKKAGLSYEMNEKLYKDTIAATPLKNVIHSEDVANIVVFLASDQARCITGSRYVIDNGQQLGDPLIRS